MKQPRVNIEARQLLRDPRFLFRASRKITELGLIAEARDQLTVLLATITLAMAITRKVSVMAAGDSSTGKSTMIEKPLMLVPPELVIRRASFSRKAFAYGEEDLNGKVLYVNEYLGSKDDHYLLRILQSNGELTHEYTTSGRTKVVQRLGSPVVLTTTTQSVIVPDDATRFLILRRNPTPEQNLAVFRAAVNTNSDTNQEPDTKVWQAALRVLMSEYKKTFQFPSWFNFVIDQIPRDRPKSCRDYNRYLGCLEAIAMCRLQLDSSPEISLADYCAAYRIFNPAFTAAAYDVGENELAVQRAVVELNKKLGRAVMIREIRDFLDWGDQMTYKHVAEAAKQKLIYYESGTKERNVKRLFPAEGGSNSFLPSPKQILENIGGLPASIEYTDPLTGDLKTVKRQSRAQKSSEG